MEKTIHQGRNVKRFREMLGIKQEALAMELGEDWNQRKISLLEQKDVIEEELLTQVAQVLKVPVEAIKNFDEEAAINIVSNTFSDFKDNASAINHNCDLNFNPIDKIVELYEALIQSEKEKVALLERMINK
jgi:transcriptional regulator with XRE-family HTH domain